MAKHVTKEDHLKRRAGTLRDSWLKRARKVGADVATVPDRASIEQWLAVTFEDQYARCTYTGSRILWSTAWQVDHYTPTSRGGSFGLSNAVVCSARVNAVKGALTGNEFRDLIKLVGGWPVKVRIEFYNRLVSAGRKYMR